MTTLGLELGGISWFHSLVQRSQLNPFQRGLLLGMLLTKGALPLRSLSPALARACQRALDSLNQVSQHARRGAVRSLTQEALQTFPQALSPQPNEALLQLPQPLRDQLRDSPSSPALIHLLRELSGSKTQAEPDQTS